MQNIHTCSVNKKTSTKYRVYILKKKKILSRKSRYVVRFITNNFSYK